MLHDDLIAGAGFSCSALAARLSEDSRRSVLPLGAGPDCRTIEETPYDLLHTSNSFRDHDWGWTANGANLIDHPLVSTIFGAGGQLLDRAMVDSKPGIVDFVRTNCTTICHPVGTAKMGPDSEKAAVVHQFCRARGVEGLRVVDASVMPNIVRANTNLTHHDRRTRR